MDYFEEERRKAKKARKKERVYASKEAEDLRAVLKTPEGRRVLWRFMEHASVFNSIWARDASIHYKSGMQDFGHMIMDKIEEADQEAMFLMMREAKQARLQQEAKEKINEQEQ